MNYTKEQQAAIGHRGGTLLVSSAAGSGKTMVLVERLLGYIDEGRNIDEFLVITYTRAAAAELRERIHTELQKRLSISPSKQHLRRQVMLCRGAYIDTIHTFCSAILRENAHLAELMPDFRIADENECAQIRNEVLQDILDEIYADPAKARELSELLKMTVDGRDDANLVELITNMHGKMRSMPGYDRWIEARIAELDEDSKITDIAETQCGKYLLDILRSKVEYCLIRMQDLKDEMQDLPDFKAKYEDSVSTTIKGIESFLAAMGKKWDEAARFANVEFPRPRNITGYNELKDVRNLCKKELENVTKHFKLRSGEHIEDMGVIAPAIKMLLELVSVFDKAFIEEKKRRGVVDFSDLEHITLSLLTDKDKKAVTPIASAISKRFCEIMVDEYQDVNEVQEMLFHALSRDGNNIFMVGDAKQSIYRFRLAEPGIFINKYNSYADLTSDAALSGKQCPPSKVNLSANFRSAPGILEAANYVFRRTMSTVFGEIVYEGAQELIAGRSDKSQKQGIQGKQGIANGGCDDSENGNGDFCNEPCVEIDLLTMPEIDETDEDSPAAIDVEAAHVAARIKKLMSDGMIIEQRDGSIRSIGYGDIAILTRSVKGITWRYASVLSKEGIPVDMTTSETYFDTIEVQAAISLLSVIDNPLDDIPLAAVLSGPVYGFTTDELSEIRAHNKNMSFYEALKRSCETGVISEETAEKCRQVLSEIDELRLISVDLPSDRFIWTVYNRTGLLTKVSILKGGEKRRQNLLALVDYAQGYEKSGFKGLFGLLLNLKALKERGVDITETPDGSPGSITDSNAVKIMSIHKSKGLEFPVVFVVNTAKQHNFKDFNKHFIFDKTLGIGGSITDTERRIRYTTLARTAIVEKQKRQMLSEELRVLYVAMTRAREKLIITATFKDAVKNIAKINLLCPPDSTAHPEVLMSMSSIAEWVIAGTQGIEVNGRGYIKINLVSDDISPGEPPAPSASSVQSAQSVPSTSSPSPSLSPSPSPSSYPSPSMYADTSATSASSGLSEPPQIDFDWKYPFEASQNLPSKLTVTGIKSISLSQGDEEAEKASWTCIKDAPVKYDTRKPVFVKASDGVSAVQRGTLLHDVMRYIDYNKCSSEDVILKDLQRVVLQGLLRESDIEILSKDIGIIEQLFSSELGKRLISSFDKDNLSREFRFSLLTEANRYFDVASNDKILVQGIIDCWFEEDGKLIIVDYKTDKVDDVTINDRIEKYAPQLEAYSEALERIMGKAVSERIIYFFETATAVWV